jgi:response regulator RpfG family c-di-GMP phosphodiesterase
MKKILFVDDEPNVLDAFQRQLRKQFPVETAVGPNAGLAALANWQDFAVVVADMRMPEMNGVEFLVKVRDMAPDLVRLMLTGNADQQTAIDAINEGSIFRFLTKPCPTEKLVGAINAALRQYQLINSERELLEKTLHGAVAVLTEILAMAEPKAFGHAEMMRDNIRRLGRAMKIGDLWQVEVAAMLSQIGSITLPPEVLVKSRSGRELSQKEQEMFQRVPTVGGSLLNQIPRLEEVSRIIIYQHKRFDGSGFPHDNVSGAALPLGARMLRALADLAELERTGRNRDSALEHMRARSGWYDPHILEALSSPTLGATLEHSGPAKPSQALTLPQLRIGQILTADVVTRNGILIVCSESRITPALMERLRNFATLEGIKEPIYVEAYERTVAPGRNSGV